MLPMLTELTIIYADPLDSHRTPGAGIISGPAASAHSTVSDLITVCKTLPYFDTLQIVHLPSPTPNLICDCKKGMRGCHKPSREQLDQTKEEVKALKKWAVECLKKSEAGRQEGEGKLKTTLRVIELGPDRPFPGSVEVKAHEV